jgi:hypothetical protein
MSEKIYCGNAKIVKTQYGELTKISFSKDDINKMFGYMKLNSADWINLVLKEKKEPQPGKPTHYLEVDNWKPSTPVNTPPSPLQEDIDELPF